MKILVTGADGFLGQNLCAVLRKRQDVELYTYDLNNDAAELDTALEVADVIVHLAGVNRPKTVNEFSEGNAGFTGTLCAKLQALQRTPKILLSSSIQAELDNPYGKSKREAEEILQKFCRDTGASGIIYRLKNLFGKWCRPNYNSVTATFCHNIANDLPIQISDPRNEVDLTYVDDVVEAMNRETSVAAKPGCVFADQLPSRRITLGELADQIKSFHSHRETLHLADYSDTFIKALYATYLSYLNSHNFSYGLDIKTDSRGSLAEFIKSPHLGQLFISRTKPGITRGNHFHHTKTEKFFVVQGKGIIRFRDIRSGEIIEYPVNGEDYVVVDIPPGYTHSIENVGDNEMVTLFWSSEVFNPEKLDTYFEPVIRPA